LSIIQELSSQAHIGSSKANLEVAKKCLADPSLLADVAANLNSHDKCLAGDCAEVMTMTAQERPDLVAPYAEALCPQIKHKAMRARWEATHALALVAHLRPEVIAGILPQLSQAIENDTSVIVRDYSVDTVANYTCAGAEESRMAFPILKRATIV
jgi:hypothetical protein